MSWDRFVHSGFVCVVTESTSDVKQRASIYGVFDTEENARASYFAPGMLTTAGLTVTFTVLPVWGQLADD